MLTLVEAGAHLRRSDSYVRTLIQKGRLPGVIEGGQLRVRRADLEQYVGEREPLIVAGLRRLRII